MPDWKKLIPKPSGALPGGLLTNVAVGLLSLLIGAMVISSQFCGAGEPTPTVTNEQQEPVAGGAGLDRRLSGMTQQQRREQQQREESERRRQKSSEDKLIAAGLGGGRVARAQTGAPRGGAPTRGPFGQGDPPNAQQFQTEAEFELMERMRLEDIERKRRSLRVGPVVLTHRTDSRVEVEEEPDEAAPVAASETPAGSDSSAAVRDALGNFQSTVEALAAAEHQSAPVEAPAVDTAAAAPPGAPGGTSADPTRITEPFNPPGWERIYEGSFLEAVLVTQLSGEFTGPVLALVAVPFYSTDRQRVLVPRGTRAIGAAQAVGGGDQERLAVGFHRLVFPDGRWVELKFDGLDQAGDAALKDKVNRHYLSMFAAVGAVGVLSGLTLRGSNPYDGGQAGFRAGAGQSIGQAGMQILSRFLNRYPTITIRAGHRLRIWFTSDVLVPRPPPQGGER